MQSGLTLLGLGNSGEFNTDDLLRFIRTSAVVDEDDAQEQTRVWIGYDRGVCDSTARTHILWKYTKGSDLYHVTNF